MKDLNQSISQALPAAAANNNSGTIDLGTSTAGNVEDVALLIEVPALPALVDAKTVIITVQDSADGVTFAAVADIGVVTLTGAGGVGTSAFAKEVKIPFNCRRYLRFNQAVLTAGGDNTAKSTTLSVITK